MSDTTVQVEYEGKKIFFLYPTPSVQSQVITELIQLEYEVYICKNHNQLARALKKYPDSILFINIDEKMAEGEWEKWIAALKSAMPDLQFGVFSSNSTEEMQDKYLKDLKISGGFFSLKVDMSKSVEPTANVLEKLQAKGRRKHIRVSTKDEQTATINMPSDGEYLNGSINDISVIGFSCIFERDSSFKKNTLYKDIQIRLKTMLLKVEAVMFGSRVSEEHTVYVFLFTQRIDSDIKVKIRKYIQQNLQSRMDSQLT